MSDCGHCRDCKHWRGDIEGGVLGVCLRLSVDAGDGARRILAFAGTTCRLNIVNDAATTGAIGAKGDLADAEGAAVPTGMFRARMTMGFSGSIQTSVSCSWLDLALQDSESLRLLRK